jgi:EEF1A lysine methyltransferase 2
MLLIELSREGYTSLTGIDYSPKAIELAKKIADDQTLNIKYKLVDLMSPEEIKNCGKFDIVHDKGKL